MDEKSKITVNRILAFIAGGLLVFLVMNFSVVSSSKARISELTTQLDASMYESGQMLKDATAQVVARDYQQAKTTLDSLFVKHPGSAEAAAGKTLYDSLVASEKKSDEKWAIAETGIQKKWASQTASEMRAKYESDMDSTLTQEWNRVKDQMRTDWEKTQG